MQQIFNFFIFAAMAAAVIVVGMGFWNMFRQGDPNVSQKLMRARIIMQAVAVALIFLAFTFFGPKG